MKDRLYRWMPSPDALRSNRWLRWLGPALHHPRLWHMSRRGIALGMALGVFFGLLIPIAQIPLAAGAAVALRANVPAAVASTLVTNPVTFGPVYYGAWRLGSAVLGEPEDDAPPALVAAVSGDAPAPAAAQATADPAPDGWWARVVHGMGQVGKPLVLGLALVATGVGLLTYLGVTWAWYAKVRWLRRQRRKRSAPLSSSPQ
jgi:uncharacterized protein (DUF2062 family)